MIRGGTIGVGGCVPSNRGPARGLWAVAHVGAKIVRFWPLADVFDWCKAENHAPAGINWEIYGETEGAELYALLAYD